MNDKQTVEERTTGLTYSSASSSSSESSPFSSLSRATGSGSDSAYGTLDDDIDLPLKIQPISGGTTPRRTISLKKNKGSSKNPVDAAARGNGNARAAALMLLSPKTSLSNSSLNIAPTVGASGQRKSGGDTSSSSERKLRKRKGKAVAKTECPLSTTGYLSPASGALQPRLSPSISNTQHSESSSGSITPLASTPNSTYIDDHLSIPTPHRKLDASSSSTQNIPNPSFLAIFPITTITALGTISISLLSVFATSASPSSPWSNFRVIPASPIHLLHPDGAIEVEYVNAMLSIFLIPSIAESRQVILSVVNLYLLSAFERKATTRNRSGQSRIGSKLMKGAFMWLSILLVRISLAGIFGRGVGWAWPELFSTRAISSVASGLAPLLLSLSIILLDQISDIPTQSWQPSTIASALLLSLNFMPFDSASSTLPGLAPSSTDFWWGTSAIVVGLVGLMLRWISEALSRGDKSSKSATKSPSPWALGPLCLLLLAPPLSTLSPSFILPSHTISTQLASTAASTEFSFNNLFPQHDKLFTVLLMTAPRPGEPEFLNRSLESWLSALPEPTSSLDATSTSTSISDRFQLIVFTHFSHHPQFEASQKYFQESLLWKKKAAKYIEWKRDPRCYAEGNRLDQRLHVARGLEYASRSKMVIDDEGRRTDEERSAYVVLTEDDFPLCPNSPSSVLSPMSSLRSSAINYRAVVSPNSTVPSFSETWNEIMRVVVATNELMPDSTPSPPTSTTSEHAVGHCGIFIATGGSGLLIRTFIAKKLPELLLGSDDVDGSRRVAEAIVLEKSGLANVLVKAEKDADTPDLVIQDCLRGRLAACSMCAPSAASNQFPIGSARRAYTIVGDRYGKSGLTGTKVLLQRHLGYNTSTLPGRKYGKEEWTCGWRQPFNGEPDVLTL